MVLWISGGGTAGHVYPALTVRDALGSRVSAVIWYGRANGMEADLVARAGIPFRAVRTGALVDRGVLDALRGAVRTVRGTLTCVRDIRRERPDAVFVTGGYVSVPLALAARLTRTPLAVYLPDIVPGLAVRLIARLADRVCVTTEAARAHLSAAKVTVTGYPVRRAVRDADRDASRARWNVRGDAPVVLVFGGSQGAHRINQAVIDAAPNMLADGTVVVHATGARSLEAVTAARDAVRTAQGNDVAARWHITAFLHEDDMAAALAAADVVVCRAGAAVLGELPARGLPAVLVPLPISGGHQWPNARVLADAGAAVAVADAEFDGPRLADEVRAILGDAEHRSAMGRAMRFLDRPDAAQAIGRVILSMAAAVAVVLVGGAFGAQSAWAHPALGGPVDSATVGATALPAGGTDLSAYALVTMLAFALIGFARGVKRETRTLLVTALSYVILGLSWTKVAGLVNKQWKMFHFGVIKRGVLADDPSVVWKSLSDLKPIVPATGPNVDVWQIAFFALAVLLLGYGVLRIPRPPRQGAPPIKLPSLIERLVGALLGSLTGFLIARFMLPRIVPGAQISIVDPRLSIAAAVGPYAPWIFFAIVVLLIFFGVKGLGGGGPRQKVYS